MSLAERSVFLFGDLMLSYTGMMSLPDLFFILMVYPADDKGVNHCIAAPAGGCEVTVSTLKGLRVMRGKHVCCLRLLVDADVGRRHLGCRKDFFVSKSTEGFRDFL